jgi:hypothetical protein
MRRSGIGWKRLSASLRKQTDYRKAALRCAYPFLVKTDHALIYDLCGAATLKTPAVARFILAIKGWNSRFLDRGGKSDEGSFS